jgi:hypothetical protein
MHIQSTTSQPPQPRPLHRTSSTLFIRSVLSCKLPTGSCLT